VTGEVKRSARVAGRLREELASAFRELRDPRVAGAAVSRVEMTDDLQLAKVYVRRLERDAGDEAAIKAMLKGLEAASGRLRREVSRTLGLRYAPTLKFFYDEAPDAIDRVEEILKEIKRGDGG
jgi:ribosome-binding factor A